MEWDEDIRYRFRGDFVGEGKNRTMLFQLDEPEMIKIEEIVLPPMGPEMEEEQGQQPHGEQDEHGEQSGLGENMEKEEIVIRKKMMVFPAAWADSFGRPVTSLACVNLFTQEQYARNWNVLRPAKELQDYNVITAESLNEMMRESEKIMEGWESLNG